MTTTEPTTTLPRGTRVRTTKAWADRYYDGETLSGVVDTVFDVAPHSPLNPERTHRVRLDKPLPWAPNLPSLTFNPADLEPDGEPQPAVAGAPSGPRSPQRVLADQLRGAAEQRWEAAGRQLDALTRAGYAVVQIEEPDDVGRNRRMGELLAGGGGCVGDDDD